MSDEQSTNPAEETAPETTDEVNRIADVQTAERKLSEMPVEEREAKHAAWLAERRKRAEDLVERSRRSWAALQGWGEVTTEEQWLAIQDQAAEDWLSGGVLLDLLGGERYLDPKKTALLLYLWHHYVIAYRPQGPAEYMCIAMALVAYHQFNRVTEAVGNLAGRLEHQLFDLSSPIQVRIVEQDGGAGSPYGTSLTRLQGQQAVEGLGRDLLPLLDRLNRLILRNLKALRDLKAAPITMTVQNFGQLNVGQQQANLAVPAPTPPPDAAAPAPEAPPRRRTRRRQV